MNNGLNKYSNDYKHYASCHTRTNKVAVILAYYNCNNYLNDQLVSIFNQSHKHLLIAGTATIYTLVNLIL